MKDIIIVNGSLVNEGQILHQDILIKNGRIEKIAGKIEPQANQTLIDASGQMVLPGVIDDQVHFREPGLTHKATIGSEARAAVAGGTTTFMEMPNTVPNALTQQLLEDKYQIAKNTSLANFSFYMGCSNENMEEALKTDPKNVCGLKIFMGSSTGNMLVDSETALETYFSRSQMLIATHCEDEATVKANSEKYLASLGENPPANIHPIIRNEEACIKSTKMAMNLAKKHGTRLHILHITTGEEAELFEIKQPGIEKRITAEACVHHLWYDSRDYETLGHQIKCNPAIKADGHKQRILQALLDNRIDVIATDHAPHLWEEKQLNYWKAPSGLPLVQHSLQMMLDFVESGKLSITKMVEKMSHSVADNFQIVDRGYIREGYFADLALVKKQNYLVQKNNIYYHCGWSPLANHTFNYSITNTIVSGHLAYSNGQFFEDKKGSRLTFNR